MIEPSGSDPNRLAPIESEGFLPSPPEVSIHVVDDDVAVVETLVTFLQGRGFQAQGFDNPLLAEAEIRRNPPHVLLTDRSMPDLGGFDLARIALEEDPDIAVIILTGTREVELAVEAFRLGAVDYLLKPLDLEAIQETVTRVLIRRSREIFHREREARMVEQLEARTREVDQKSKLLEEVTVGALSALVRTLERRTPHFHGHSQAVADLSEKLAAELGLPAVQVRWCRAAGFLHDIGMIAIPDSIVEKSTALTPEESAKIQEHCRIGREILQPFPHLGPVPEYVYLHHERVDGSGYPGGLRGEGIPIGAQVVAAADSYRALVEPRPFRPAHPPSEAMEILIGTAGIWHYSEILKALARVLPS